MITDYKLVYLRSRIKHSKRTDNNYVEYNYVLEVPFTKDGDIVNTELRKVSGFTISDKDIMDLGNRDITINPDFITEQKGKDRDGNDVIWYNYDIDKAKDPNNAVKSWAKGENK